MSSYAAAVESLYALGAELAPELSSSFTSVPGVRPRRKFDLDHMRALAAALGNPEQRFPSVLIAGTNGKGSTAATLASILTASGYSTALYTSPHLIRVNERIRINGNTISDADFAAIHHRVQAAAAQLVSAGMLPQMPSFFETVTAMAFDYFAAQQVDIAILEVGLGGRLDATTIVSPLLSVITDIDLDHQQWLGDTLAEIAREKAGILRPHGTAIFLPQHPIANQVLGEVSTELNARVINAADLIPSTSPADSSAESIYQVDWLGAPILVDSPLHGRHQWRNLALSLAAARELKTGFGFDRITHATVQAGVHDTRWPGRFQSVHHRGRDYILDVAHNPAGAWALRAALSQFARGASPLTSCNKDRLLTLIFGAMQDKKIDDIASVLFPIAEQVILTRADSPRAADPADIAAQSAHTGADFLLTDSVSLALQRAREISTPGALIVITGSVYIVGAALAQLAPESAS